MPVGLKVTPTTQLLPGVIAAAVQDWLKTANSPTLPPAGAIAVIDKFAVPVFVKQ
ncbi:MAG: hypothetical protein U0232_09625 [Thermomicrobiales bacterium]